MFVLRYCVVRLCGASARREWYTLEPGQRENISWITFPLLLCLFMFALNELPWLLSCCVMMISLLQTAFPLSQSYDVSLFWGLMLRDPTLGEWVQYDCCERYSRCLPNRMLKPTDRGSVMITESNQAAVFALSSSLSVLCSFSHNLK